MDEAALRKLLDDVRTGATRPDDAVEALRHLPYSDLGFARVDHHRHLRQGMAEAVYGPGKTPDQVVRIVAELLARSGAAPVVLTRASSEQARAAIDANHGATIVGGTLVWRAAPPRHERVVLLTAGTADLPVADECAATLTAHGLPPVRLTDVGVAGIHRLLEHVDALIEADAVIVVAGMEGALASVVGGLTGAPVVAVPTSVGYGAGLDGVTALLGMLASCAAGIGVVGIDNGYGAACVVARQFLTPERRSLANRRSDEEAERAAVLASRQAAGGPAPGLTP
ncbi:nickel pincer cofactor biosynthesis protein LarB [Aquihabitans sp. G128]|uniref:nickel pincer cofactor biosynthesis protein LarB n=1 Tax=Aquihabitans sp. G128 TaxID=2849779 RepID=UPI0020B38CF3|nr:nickel pincer cofactor biosynthesis protein LarB [Aquihabitans sp. G128]